LWGFPLGYWFATQGSIILFVVLAFAYCLIMSKLDRSLGLHE
jgi:putative solute:sodium symporter small subunit